MRYKTDAKTAAEKGGEVVGAGYWTAFWTHAENLEMSVVRIWGLQDLSSRWCVCGGLGAPSEHCPRGLHTVLAYIGLQGIIFAVISNNTIPLLVRHPASPAPAGVSPPTVLIYIHHSISRHVSTYLLTH